MPHLRERGALPLIPTRTQTEIAIAAALVRIHVSAEECGPCLFSCKQQEKNRGGERNARKINGKSERRQEKNRQ
jgi:hypothetical protein